MKYGEVEQEGGLKLKFHGEETQLSLLEDSHDNETLPQSFILDRMTQLMLGSISFDIQALLFPRVFNTGCIHIPLDSPCECDEAANVGSSQRFLGNI